VPPDRLDDAADSFAQDLLDVLELICPHPNLALEKRDDGMAIRPDRGLAAEAGLMPTTMDGIDVKFFYRCDLDPDGGYLRILASSMGMSLTPTGRCLVRVEYDRGKGRDRSDSHVQVDADGLLLGLALARSGQAARPMHDVHIPAGGRRFRPTMEDFVEFLLAEGFVRPTRADWRPVLHDKRTEWEARQAAAAARRYPAAASEALIRLGYSVIPPPC
jgi:hypothetical protein